MGLYAKQAVIISLISLVGGTLGGALWGAAQSNQIVSNLSGCLMINNNTDTRIAIVGRDRNALRFEVETSLIDSTAWVGVVPSSVPHGSEEINDRSDISYVYLVPGVRQYILPIPDQRGIELFDLRVNSRDSGGIEVAHTRFFAGRRGGCKGIQKCLDKAPEVIFWDKNGKTRYAK